MLLLSLTLIAFSVVYVVLLTGKLKIIADKLSYAEDKHLRSVQMRNVALDDYLILKPIIYLPNRRLVSAVLKELESITVDYELKSLQIGKEEMSFLVVLDSNKIVQFVDDFGSRMPFIDFKLLTTTRISEQQSEIQLSVNSLN
jgi:hypothetical protein